MRDPEVVAFHETKHRETIDQVEKLYAFGLRFLDEIDFQSLVDDDGNQLAASFCARALTALRSVHVLFLNGNETDAFSVLRTIVELTIDFEFIWTRKDRKTWVKRFTDENWLSSQKMEEALSAVYGREYMEANEAEQVEWARQMGHPEFQDKESYRAWKRSNLKRVNKLKERWRDLSFEKRAKKLTKDRFLYDVVYAMCCEAVHSNMSSMHTFRFEGVRPQRIEGAMLLELAGVLCWMMLVRATDHFGKLNSEAVSLFKGFDVVANLPASASVASEKKRKK